jgi:colanic acid biosynthesis glycosyl transferase WcaI
LKILLLNQVFYPDVVATAQHLADLGSGLSEAGHEVTVLCSSHAYADPSQKFSRDEMWRGIRIKRVTVWGLGKKSKIRRIVSFATFFASSLAALLLLPRQDLVVVTPPPPLLSVMAALFVKFRGGRLLYWIMDLNPDEAIAAGWMSANSLTARTLEAALGFSLRVSTSVVVLDRFMKARIVAKGVSESKVHIVPVWAHDEAATYDPEGREHFRKQFGVGDKFVVMYSGNHSPLHPFDTLLEAAKRLRNNSSVAFLFVGGGSELPRIKKLAHDFELENMICDGYKPLAQLAGSLSAADMQVVLLGDPFVGIVHPCKIYNMLAIGAPFLYVGPAESHITDLKQHPEIAEMGHFVRHGDVDQVVEVITRLAADFIAGRSSRPGQPVVFDQFSKQTLLPAMIRLIEAAGSTDCDSA